MRNHRNLVVHSHDRPDATPTSPRFPFLDTLSEFPYHEYPDEEGDKYPSLRLTFPNSWFEPTTANALFKRYFDECVYADELGFDGIMLNEHHSTPSCMNAATNLSAAVLARITHQAKILLLGNILPIHDNPVRLAEELAMIDVISGGRLISGFVRGTGVETVSTNNNPLANRERFEECHLDFAQKLNKL